MDSRDKNFNIHVDITCYNAKDDQACLLYRPTFDIIHEIVTNKELQGNVEFSTGSPVLSSALKSAPIHSGITKIHYPNTSNRKLQVESGLCAFETQSYCMPPSGDVYLIDTMLG